MFIYTHFLDLAIVKLSDTVKTPFHTRGIYVDLIRLNSNMPNSNLVGRKMFISGWGRFGPRKKLSQYLRFTELPMSKPYKGSLRFKESKTHAGQCQGDSGGTSNKIVFNQ